MLVHRHELQLPLYFCRLDFAAGMGMGVREIPLAMVIWCILAGRAGDGLAGPIPIQASLDRDRTRPLGLASLWGLPLYADPFILALTGPGAGQRNRLEIYESLGGRGVNNSIRIPANDNMEYIDP